MPQSQSFLFPASRSMYELQTAPVTSAIADTANLLMPSSLPMISFRALLGISSHGFLRISYDLFPSAVICLWTPLRLQLRAKCETGAADDCVGDGQVTPPDNPSAPGSYAAPPGQTPRPMVAAASQSMAIMPGPSARPSEPPHGAAGPSWALRGPLSCRQPETPAPRRLTAVSCLHLGPRRAEGSEPAAGAQTAAVDGIVRLVRR